MSPAAPRPDHPARRGARAARRAPACSWSAPSRPRRDDLLDRARRRRTSPRCAPRRTTARPDPARGLGTEDDPVFAGMHDAAARVVTGSLDRRPRGVVRAGAARGEHRRRHAPRDAGRGRRASASTTTPPSRSARLLADGRRARRLRRRRRPPRRRRRARVLGRPARADDLGARERPDPVPRAPATRRTSAGRGAEGTAVNVALPAGHRRPRLAARGGRRRAEPVVRAFAPDVLVSQHGCDAHRHGPARAPAGQRGRPAVRRASGCTTLAHEVAGGRWVALGGGGYDRVRRRPAVVDAPHRGCAAHADVDPATRRCRRAGGRRCETLSGAPAPETMGDGADLEFRPWSAGLRPGRRPRPGDPRHPARGVPAPRARPALRLTARARPGRRRRCGRHPCGRLPFHTGPTGPRVNAARPAAGGTAQPVGARPAPSPRRPRPCRATSRPRAVPHRRRGRRDHARLQDDGVPAACTRARCPAVRVGRSFRVPKDALDHYLATRRHRGRPADVTARTATAWTLRVARAP